MRLEQVKLEQKGNNNENKLDNQANANSVSFLK